jgi:hypothetical protein
MLRHVQRQRLDVTTTCFGVAVLAIAVALALWPLHSNGLRGNTIAPQYSRYVGFTSYVPLAAQPTTADLRRAGITLPRDVVAKRRHDAETLAAVGILITGLGLAMHRNAGRRGLEP